MNWQQLYTTAKPYERLEIMLHMLSVIETRQRRLFLVRGRLIHERRRAHVAHFIHDRRSSPHAPYHSLAGRPTLIAFAFILTTLSIATWLIAAHIQPIYGAPLLFGYNLLLIAILLIKPSRRIHRFQPLPL